MTYAIEMQDLTKVYGRHRGIQEVNLTVEEGDMFGYLGPNGAGKSTSIRCLLGLLRISSGQARVFGLKVGKEQRDILEQVGYMPSEPFFYPSMSVDEVISYAAKARGMDCGDEAARLCERLEVERKKKIYQLSLGNRKKVSIVCALQHQPKLLILDEPTSGLDPLMQEAFFELLTERNRQGTTCFLSSHVLQEVKRYCRHAGIIKDGRLVRVDTVENLTKTNLRRIKLSGIAQLPEVRGISQAVKSGDEYEFSYQGEIGELLAALQGQDRDGLGRIKDMLISEPSLEEVFMHFYEEAGV